MLMERYPDANPIQALCQQREQDGNLKLAMDMIKNSNIVEDCYEVIRGHCQEARDPLESLPDCDARRSLMQLTDFIWERSH